MSSRRPPDAIYLAFALLLALTLRLVHLGQPALTDAEAAWALQALRAADGLRPALGPFPAYLLPTTLLFFLFDATNFLARLVPALAGAALACAPFLFRERLGKVPAIVLAFALAVEPGLVALSRQAGTPILAVTFALFALGAWENEKPRAAGLLAGLALLSGPWTWAGLLGLTLAFGLLLGADQFLPAGPAPRVDLKAGLKSAWPYLLGALLSGGLLFLFSSNTLSAWLAALPGYIGGWTRPSGVPAGRLLLAFLAYPLMAIPFALVALVRGILDRARNIVFLGLWLLTALLLALSYPARQTGDLAWALIPLWALAAGEIARAFYGPASPRAETLGAFALTFIILVFMWFNFLPLANLTPASPDFAARLALLLGGLLLLGLSLALVGLGWSARIAIRGGTWGALLALGLYTLAMAVYAPGLRANRTVELWTLGAPVAQADLLSAEIDDRSEWESGHDDGLPVAVAGLDSPALEWLLRGRIVTMTAAPDLSATPPLIVTGLVDSPGLTAGYRGQDFVWGESLLNDLPASQWVSWLPFHRIYVNPQIVILWVRDDLFLDSAAP